MVLGLSFLAEELEHVASFFFLSEIPVWPVTNLIYRILHRPLEQHRPFDSGKTRLLQHALMLKCSCLKNQFSLEQRRSFFEVTSFSTISLLSSKYFSASQSSLLTGMFMLSIQLLGGGQRQL